MTLNLTRLIAAAALMLPAATMISSPVFAATSTKTKTHHVSVHKTSSHKTAHHKKAVSATS
jgi:hypothetical protein